MRYRTSFQMPVSFGLHMKTRPALSVLAMLLVAGFGNCLLSAAEDDGVALAIVYDTSGSMKEDVRAASGRHAPKYQVANRALMAVASQIEAFSTNTASGGPRRIDAGLYIFQGDHAREVVKFGPFDRLAFENFAKRFRNPNGNTPLGNSLDTAAGKVLASPLPRKHVLIITDGLNTIGPKPETVFPQLKQQAADKQTTISVHFVAFDVDGRQFAPLKRLGATVVAASDETQLNAQLQFILQRKILLEDEEPPQKK